ncbi:hypothetical protein, conserved [Eimeria tenella]|uniref:Uncharacterized protein n=1 Tax=Eimeria tenella TaxID=5802 RepID=U6LBS9_EIMTE|nr:hypothetical protein, conserved [Eimeria tenella]CDJ45215.1 hypothetical protein, conserved [Eimeria tenella]|eukprot:XP_013235962.1 hypothetical protein, conserved [Eimeria tenella]
MKLQDQEPLQGRTRSSSTSSNSTMQQLLFDPFCPHPLIILTGAGLGSKSGIPLYRKQQQQRQRKQRFPKGTQQTGPYSKRGQQQQQQQQQRVSSSGVWGAFSSEQATVVKALESPADWMTRFWFAAHPPGLYAQSFPSLSHFVLALLLLQQPKRLLLLTQNVDNLERYALLLLLSLFAAPESALRLFLPQQNYFRGHQQQQSFERKGPERQQQQQQQQCCLVTMENGLLAAVRAAAAPGAFVDPNAAEAATVAAAAASTGSITTAAAAAAAFPLNYSLFHLPSFLPLVELHGNVFFFRCVGHMLQQQQQQKPAACPFQFDAALHHTQVLWVSISEKDGKVVQAATPFATGAVEGAAAVEAAAAASGAAKGWRLQPACPACGSCCLPLCLLFDECLFSPHAAFAAEGFNRALLLAATAAAVTGKCGAASAAAAEAAAAQGLFDPSFLLLQPDQQQAPPPRLAELQRPSVRGVLQQPVAAAVAAAASGEHDQPSPAGTSLKDSVALVKKQQFVTHCSTCHCCSGDATSTSSKCCAAAAFHLTCRGGARCACNICCSPGHWLLPRCGASMAAAETAVAEAAAASATDHNSGEAGRSAASSCPSSSSGSRSSRKEWVPGAPPVALLLGTSLTTASSDWLLLLLQQFGGEALAVNNGDGPLDVCFDFNVAQQQVLIDTGNAVVKAALSLQQEQQLDDQEQQRQQELCKKKQQQQLRAAQHWGPSTDTSSSGCCCSASAEQKQQPQPEARAAAAAPAVAAAAAELRQCLSLAGPQFEYAGAAAAGGVAVTCRSRRVRRLREDLGDFLERLCPSDTFGWLQRHHQRLRDAHKDALAAAWKAAATSDAAAAALASSAAAAATTLQKSTEISS